MPEQGPGDKPSPDRKRQAEGSGFDPPGAKPKATLPNLPRTTNPGVARTSTGSLPAHIPAPVTSPGIPTTTSPGIAPSQYLKKIQTSSFNVQNERTRMEAILGSTSRPGPEEDEEEDEPTAVGFSFDGKSPAKGVTSRDLWRAINAPVQSREGRRSANLYRMVIDQFAVGNNERYLEDGPGKPRAHIFIWDLTRAMNAEVPHFVGAKELSLGQTCDWVRHEGPMRGWQRTDPDGAQEAANEGYPVLVLPKEIKLKLMGVVRPGELGSDGKPRLAAAAKVRGNDLSTHEALGVFAVEYFAHP